MATPAEFRQSLMDELAAAFPAIRFYAGRTTGPSEDRDMGVVWWEGTSDSEDGLDLEELVMRVKVLKLYTAPQGPIIDTAELEDLDQTVRNALKDKQDAQFGVWYFRVSESTPIYEENAVEFLVVARQANQFTY